MTLERLMLIVAGWASAALVAGCAPPAERVTMHTDAMQTEANGAVVSMAAVPATAPVASPTPLPTTSVGADRRTAAPPRVAAPAVVSEGATRVSVPTTTTRYVVPVADPARAGWNPTHASYRATDIFVAGGCGGTAVSPVDGVVVHVRTIDSWDRQVDDPATRGGRSVAIRGFDGVRYYLAHFATIDTEIVLGGRVAAGTPLGTVGESGRASACHIHFGISPPCPDEEWSVRRGVIWPYPYLDAWQRGDQLSPAPEIAAWVSANPDACSIATE
ncbi:MAG: M23 family metallopeptidase [Ilumatobacter sp.]|nr:M23 family metallopeptidase [Ilumatobacter sp.]